MTQATILHEAEMELWETVAYYEDKAAGPSDPPRDSRSAFRVRRA